MTSEVLVEEGGMTLVRHTVPAGFDSAPLYRGLPDDMCPCEHWCYLARGELRYRFADGGSCTPGPATPSTCAAATWPTSSPTPS